MVTVFGRHLYNLKISFTVSLFQVKGENFLPKKKKKVKGEKKDKIKFDYKLVCS